jgi:predicted nucleic acid-binding protein
MGDALIAATAIEHQLPVLTANVKHFSAVAVTEGRGVLALTYERKAKGKTP